MDLGWEVGSKAGQRVTLSAEFQTALSITQTLPCQLTLTEPGSSSSALNSTISPVGMVKTWIIGKGWPGTNEANARTSMASALVLSFLMMIRLHLPGSQFCSLSCRPLRSWMNNRVSYPFFFEGLSGACVRTEPASFLICCVVKVLGARSPREAILAIAGLVFSFLAIVVRTSRTF